jgi:hypothetical protein
VSVTIFDVAGRRVAEVKQAGNADDAGRLAWDGMAANGEPAASGVYFAALKVNGVQQCVQRFVLAK